MTFLSVFMFYSGCCSNDCDLGSSITWDKNGATFRRNILTLSSGWLIWFSGCFRRMKYIECTVRLLIFYPIRAKKMGQGDRFCTEVMEINPLNPELNPICYLLTLLAHHFLHVSRIRVKSLTIRLQMSYMYGGPILDVSRSHTTTHHSR